jgi:hypothetical protein
MGRRFFGDRFLVTSISLSSQVSYIIENEFVMEFL